MEDKNLIQVAIRLSQYVVILFALVLLGIGTLFSIYFFPEKTIALFKEKERETVVLVPGIVDGLHVETGLIDGEGLMLVVNNCTNCHSAKLVTQNRATKEGWTQIIRWMQETQNLWDLGENEEVIVNYLSKHYAPESSGRRKPLEVEWYELE
jgi:hypothetical protein